MDSTHTFIQIHPKDNTAVALTSLKKDLLESAFFSSLVASLLPIIMKKSYWKRSAPNVLFG